MNAPVFDPTSFANSTFESGIDSRSIPHPADGEYQGWIGTEEADINFRTTNNGSTILELQVYTDNPQVCEVTGRNPTKVRWSGFLDLTETGGLDFAPGKNRRLGGLLTALGFQNLDGTASKPWKFTDFHGKPLTYTVNHRAAPDGSGVVYDEVARVARVG
jgi:hypothetical protein